MKKHYTKRQIIESIKHWKNVLKMMNESEEQMHKDLHSLFGNSLYDANAIFDKKNHQDARSLA